MNYQEREEIFSKEVLHINDVSKLMDCSYSEACNLIKTWKRKLQFKDKKLRLEVSGRIHIHDYFDVMGINPDHPGDRYFKKKEFSVYDELAACDSETRKKIYTY